MHSLYKGVFIFGLALLASSLPAPGPQCQSQTVEEAKKSERSLASFAVELYKNVSDQGKPNKNEALSPVSIALALAMLENGADGDTRQQIQKQLIELGAGQNVLSVYSALQKQLDIDRDDTQLKLANAIFNDKTAQLKSDYQTSTTQCLQAKVQQVDYQNQLEQARQQINKFVSDKTNKKIDELFKKQSLSAESKIVLANAVYLKAQWQKAFSKSATKQGIFYEKGGVQHPEKVDYLVADGQYRASADEKLQILELKYKQGDLSMYVFLPKERAGINDFEKQLTGDKFRQMIAQLKPQNIHVELPKFEIKSPTDLKVTLRQMGLTQLFTKQADLSRMSDQKLEISHAVHQAYMKIDEDGTEAAAATGFEAVNEFVMPGAPTAKFVADHPFTYAIVHSQTRAVVFIGRVEDPREK